VRDGKHPQLAVYSFIVCIGLFPVKGGVVVISSLS